MDVTVCDAADVAALSLNINLCIQFFSQSVKKLFQIEESDIGQSLSKVKFYFNDPGFFKRIQKVFNGTKIKSSEVYVAGNGKWYLQRVVPYQKSDGKISSIIITFFDITVLKTRERELCEKEKRYRTVTFISPVGIFFADADMRNFYMNERCCEITGLTLEEAKGVNWAKAIHPDDRQHVVANWNETIKRHTPMKVECRFRRPDGTIRWTLCQMVVERGEWQEVKGLIGTITDTTRLHETEEMLRQQQVELMNISRLSEIKEIASGMAHELNQPLTSIVQYVGGCLTRLRKENTPQEIVDTMEKVMRQAERTGEIIHRLKNFLRKGKLQKKNVDINRILRDLVKLMDIKQLYSDVDLSFELDWSLPEIYVDKVHVEQVMINLFQNSLDSMREAQVENPRLVVQTRKSPTEEGVEIIVSDTGPGIPHSLKTKIFEPFFTTKPSGMGIGLSLSHSIVEAHNGSLFINSEVNQGAEFHLIFPLSDHLE